MEKNYFDYGLENNNDYEEISEKEYIIILLAKLDNVKPNNAHEKDILLKTIKILKNRLEILKIDNNDIEEKEYGLDDDLYQIMEHEEEIDLYDPCGMATYDPRSGYVDLNTDLLSEDVYIPSVGHIKWIKKVDVFSQGDVPNRRSC